MIKGGMRVPTGSVWEPDAVNTKIVLSNKKTNTSNFYEYEYEYSEMLLIRIQIRIFHESIRECIHEYFSLEITLHVDSSAVSITLYYKYSRVKRRHEPMTLQYSVHVYHT